MACCGINLAVVLVEIYSTMNEQEDIAEWFLTKADPEHAPLEYNGIRWSWENDKWVCTVINKNWRDYWDRRNEKVMAHNIATLTYLQHGLASPIKAVCKKKVKSEGR